MTIRLFVPQKQETYSVAARPITRDELLSLAKQIIDQESIWQEDKREWQSLDMFLGFHLAITAFEYQLTPDQIQDLVALLTLHLNHLRPAPIYTFGQ